MKYIRTEDGKIYNKSKIICSAFREEYCSPNWNDDIEKYLQTKIIAETDTIEDLCDEFVIVDKYGNKPRMVITEGFAVKMGHTVFGAIWTDKGLIYVAKMNEKGELELL